MKTTKFLAAILVISLMFSVTAIAATPMVIFDKEKKTSMNLIEQYADCVQPAWYGPAIEYALENNIMEGVGNYHMEPNRFITRAEFVTVVCRLFATYNQADIEHYEDVPSDKWYCPYVAMGEQMGIVEGFSSSEFAPEAPITREQAWTILARIMSLPSGDLSVLDRFMDREDISEWAAGPAAAMVIQGRLQGYLDGLVRPGQDITRAETAQLLMMCFPFLNHGDIANGIFTDNALLYPNKNGTITTEFKNMEVRGTLILATGLGDGIVNLIDANIGRLVCWGAHDVYIYPGCYLDEITISRTDGPCIIHWPGSAADLPPIYFGDNVDMGSKVVDGNGNTLYEPTEDLFDPDTPTSDAPIRPSRPVYVYKERVYFYPQNNGSKTPFIQEIGDSPYLVPVSIPEWEGHVFGGWYLDEELETRFSFTQKVEDGLRLYGKWYTDAEWVVVEQMNKMVASSTIRVACETDILATVGEDTIPCYIHNDAQQTLTISLVEPQTGVTVAVIDKLEPGETAHEMRVISMPAYGNYATKLVCEDIAGGGHVEFESTLFIAYFWHRGE